MAKSFYGSPKETHTTGACGTDNEMPRVGPGSAAKSVKSDPSGYPSAPAGSGDPKGMRIQRKGE